MTIPAPILNPSPGPSFCDDRLRFRRRHYYDGRFNITIPGALFFNAEFVFIPVRSCRRSTFVIDSGVVLPQTRFVVLPPDDHLPQRVARALLLALLRLPSAYYWREKRRSVRDAVSPVHYAIIRGTPARKTRRTDIVGSLCAFPAAFCYHARTIVVTGSTYIAVVPFFPYATAFVPTTGLITATQFDSSLLVLPQFLTLPLRASLWRWLPFARTRTAYDPVHLPFLVVPLPNNLPVPAHVAVITYMHM